MIKSDNETFEGPVRGPVFYRSETVKLNGQITRWYEVSWHVPGVRSGRYGVTEREGAPVLLRYDGQPLELDHWRQALLLDLVEDANSEEGLAGEKADELIEESKRTHSVVCAPWSKLLAQNLDYCADFRLDHDDGLGIPKGAIEFVCYREIHTRERLWSVRLTQES